MAVGIVPRRGPAHHPSRPGDLPLSFSMRVSSRAHYGLRMMTQLAQRYGDGPESIADIARAESLPLAYLEQLAGTLRRGGLVESTRGVRGGYSLTRSPELISVLEVVRTLEGEVAPVECAATDYVAGTCARDAECASRGLWQRLKQSIDDVLGQATLAELIHDRSLIEVMAPESTPLVVTSDV